MMVMMLLSLLLLLLFVRPGRLDKIGADCLARTKLGVWIVVFGWLLNVPATCECISGTDLLRQVYVLPH